MSHKHTFHIPVMGTGFTLDTPLKVAHLGIDSVVSVVDDVLIEKMRRMLCVRHNIGYKAISDKVDDFRARRITTYLNLLNDLVHSRFDAMKSGSRESLKEITKYLDLLPDSTDLIKQFYQLKNNLNSHETLNDWVDKNLRPGRIDVNIMTKLDKSNSFKGEPMSVEHNDAHAALRGFAESNLESSVVFSAGMNPRLYNYLESFDDFYPDEDGNIKKKVVLKVSDYRSALIQGKFLAKKGIWVSEYRIESGLNCGGHAFATEGSLMGPILEEFKKNKLELHETLENLLIQTLRAKNKTVPSRKLKIKVTAQGGVGTYEEHQFLMEKYQLDSIGWGSPFLLVPEATTVDEETMNKLVSANEEDLYLSNISPLGVPFNNLKDNSKDLEKIEKITAGRPGSPCPKEFLALQQEPGSKNLCTASRQYQRNKLKLLDPVNLSKQEYKKRFQAIVDKACLCVGLGQASMEVYNLELSPKKKGVSICPGPNMAYFERVLSLREMTDHIYGRINVIARKNRPQMFVKELQLYLSYLSDKIDDIQTTPTKQQLKYLERFMTNLQQGIDYYLGLNEQFARIEEELKYQVARLKQLNVRLSAL